MLFGANGGIAAHGLVVDRDSAIYATAAEEVIHDACDVIVLVFGAVLGADDLPVVTLRPRRHAEKSDSRGDKKRRKDKKRITSGKLHSRLLRGGTPPPHFFQCKAEQGSRSAENEAAMS